MNKKHSFTLIELVISILLSSIIAISSYSAYFYINLVVNKKMDLIYLNEMALHTLTFLSRDIRNAGYTEQFSANGEILTPILLTNNHNITLTYDFNETRRIIRNYVYEDSNDTIFINEQQIDNGTTTNSIVNQPIAVNVSSLQFVQDVTNPKRITINLNLTTKNQYNGNNITRNFIQVEYQRN